MAGNWGYRSYRGRTPRWKYALAAVLVIVILAAVGFIILQENVVYDESGMPHLRLPEKAEEPVKEEVELTIQPPEGPGELRAVQVPAGRLTQEVWQKARQAAPLCSGAAVTLKDDTGKVWFDSTAAVSGTTDTAPDTAEVLEQIAGEETYALARLSCFHDSRAANLDIEGMGLKNTGGYIFYDGANSQWMDPAKPAARQYLCQMAVEAAELGFDEVLLTDVSYPTVGKLDKIAYGEGEKSGHLAAFLQEVRAALEPYGVMLSVELPEAAIAAGEDAAAGISLVQIAPLVDRVYARTEPEKAASLEEAVKAAGGTAFVPELTAPLPEGQGSFLLLPET